MAFVMEFIPLPSPYRSRHYCDCGEVFEANTEAEAERLHAEHQDEMSDPAAHQGDPF